MRRFAATPVIIFLITLTACLSSKKSGDINDFRTSGFLNDNTFQVIITASPGPSARGLVDQRESSFFAAAAKIPEETINSMVQYLIDKELEKHDPGSAESLDRDKTASDLRADLIRYKYSGFIAAEYYMEDNSVVLAYRINNPGIKPRIDSTRVSLTFKEQGKN